VSGADFNNWYCLDCGTKVGAVGASVVGYVFLLGPDLRITDKKQCEICYREKLRAKEGWTSALAKLI